MGMTIDESISELKWVRKVNEEILKTDAKEIDVDSAWIKHWENVVMSLDTAIDTMRKYQQLQADYENRLKADMVAMLTDFLMDIEENTSINSNDSHEKNGKRLMRIEIIGMFEKKINSLKEGEV